MSHRFFYFRSFQIAVLLLLMLMLVGCSYLPAITPIAQNDIAATTDDATSSLGTTAPPPPEQVDGKPVASASPETIVDNDDAIANGNTTTPPKENGKNPEQGEDQSMKIAITFDDGPDLKYTPKILDILKEKNVKASFFVVGIQVNKYPEVLQRIEKEGHFVGNHSYTHRSFTKLTSDELKEEINSTDSKIEAAIGYVPEIVRPPYGAVNDDVKDILKSMGKETILWTIDPRDWDGSSVDDMLDNIMSNAKDGGNILLHSFGSKFVENTVELLPTVIDQLREKGYTFVTVDKL